MTSPLHCFVEMGEVSTLMGGSPWEGAEKKVEGGREIEKERKKARELTDIDR